MKKLILSSTLVSLILTGTLTASNKFEEFEEVRIHQLTPKQPNTIKFKMNFAGNTFISKSDMIALQNKGILQIDLVYTSFKKDKNFDQLALNKKRITQLKNEYPIFSNKNIKWHLIEQDGTTNIKQAKDYFHGFVVHYGKSINYKTLSNAYSEIQKEFNVYPMNNSGGVLNYTSGTKIKIQPYSVTYEDGTPVTGEFEIKYREFRNAAEIAFSGIPMTFNDQNFNSVGMYEIRGEQDGKTLKLTKPTVVNFQCTKGDAGVGFYHLDESARKWKKVKQITKVRDSSVMTPNNIKREGKINEMAVSGSLMSKSWKTLAEKKTLLHFSEESWKCYNEALIQVKDSVRELKRDDKKREIVLSVKSIELINQKIEGDKIPNHFYVRKRIDVFFPSLVKGLKSNSFGVYNCDQVYRISNRITLRPKYIDKNGNQIKNQYVLCVVDLNYNGSFSYNPNSINVNKKGENVLLLFTEDKRLFVLSERAYKKMSKNSTQPTIVMKNMTSELSSTEALKEYLNL